MSNPLVAVSHDTQIPYVEFQGQAVVTFAMVDKVHCKADGTSRKQFDRNRKHFAEGEDFHRIDSSQMSHFATFGISVPPRGLIVLTESGYLLLVKSFTDDLAWQVQKQLIKIYFRAKALVAPPPEAPVETLSSKQYDELVRALRPFGWLFARGSAETAFGDHLRTTLGVRHLKDIPAAKFELAMQVANGLQVRATAVHNAISAVLDEAVREVVAAGSPSTLVLARQYKQRFKAEVPTYPNWLEIQRALAAPQAGDLLDARAG